MSLVMTPQALSPSDVAPLAPRISTRLEISTSSNSPPSSSPFAENLPEVISNGAFSKTWVLPPRKKPGRKAANDVPPTKRQAQNRAAQKAFRDRKAQRVVELEKENEELRDRIDRMEAELNVLRTATSAGYQQSHRQQSFGSHSSPSQQLASPAPSGGGAHCDTCVVGKDCACINNLVIESTTSAITIPQSPKENSDVVDDPCGLCLTGSCLCRDLGIRETEPPQQQQQPSPSSPPSPSQGVKRKRPLTPSPSQPLLSTPESYPMEIDFTSAFTAPSSFTGTLSPTATRDGIPSGGCGFCSDSTPCVCLQNTLPPLQSDLSSLTPEAHPESIRRGGGKRPQATDIKLVGPSVPPRVGSPQTILAAGNGGCTGVPGTCLQCRMDPMSTLFCQTLSRKLEMPVSSIRSAPVPSRKPERRKDDMYLPCSAVYQTLSRHHNFNKMSLEVIVDGLAKGEHRGMEFSVGGVQGLLKEMDKGEISQEE